MIKIVWFHLKSQTDVRLPGDVPLVGCNKSNVLGSEDISPNNKVQNLKNNLLTDTAQFVRSAFRPSNTTMYWWDPEGHAALQPQQEGGGDDNALLTGLQLPRDRKDENLSSRLAPLNNECVCVCVIATKCLETVGWLSDMLPCGMESQGPQWVF